ncbi:FHS family L-fucose permease-like MFS transporter [Catalinimonas alkaloidigena]|uniref:L-fucose:H+ symporter permease n=1 Tax=Catalinimonas alkaloidigena TaxID=1075417 RepID=UPI002405FCA8|nr:L-fucose:H+ symporter permease [Catalinimonas alkaloidigena]MDF9797797.1 FHS family L-fucose permease-like MFS transporter [Catalinimonas alkaloidigena]
MNNNQKTPLLPFILITSLFLMWGLANNMTDTLLAAFKKIMSMSDFQTSWIQLAFYGSYFCLALPAALYIKRFTYKSGVLLGLGMFIVGSMLFYPASQTMVYGHFLAALFVLAGGLSILETAANPYIIAMGPEKSGTRRLNLAQAFNPIGSIVGVLLSKVFILSQLNEASAESRALMSAEELKDIQASELSAVMGPYVGVAFILLLLWIIIAITKMPKASDEGHNLQLAATFARLFKRSNYVWGVAAQFFYVGAQIGVWSYTIRYVMLELDVNEELAADYYLAALVLFMVSRFIFTALMKYISPGNLLSILAFLASALSLVVMTVGGIVGVYALVAISACMSLMFPTIYGLAVRGLGNDTKIGGSGLIMAILGGAVLTAVQGQLSDLSGSIRLAYIVPLLCFIIVAIYGRVSEKKKAAVEDKALTH